MTLSELTKEERSLLLFFETCHVDYGGLLDPRRMNESDQDIARDWRNRGFIRFGRITAEWLEKYSPCSYYVWLSDEAFELAHQERRERAERMKAKREWYTTDEKRMS